MVGENGRVGYGNRAISRGLPAFRFGCIFALVVTICSTLCFQSMWYVDIFGIESGSGDDGYFPFTLTAFI